MNEKLQTGLQEGIKKGYEGFIWMMKIVIPISLLTAILDWSGLLTHLDFFLKPLMGALSLPPEAALPLLIGILSSVYAAIAAMIVFPFSAGQITLMAVFVLTAHALIQEGIIQGKSGIHPLKATLVRLGAAAALVLLIAPWAGSSALMSAAAMGKVAANTAFSAMIGRWAITTAWLIVKIFLIIIALLTVLELLKTFDLIHPFVRALSPFLRLMGLNQRVGFLWMTAVVFGLSYGGAVIVEEAKNGRLNKEELELLHLSIGMNHSMVEDPPLFMALGVNPLWLYLPRLLMAIVIVRLVRFYQYLTHRQPSLASRQE
ncbi:MAG: hypothetical protein K0B01_08460 [Syntrophobacterales bacterium]|nr:hypothetical protein [Syntrophobacterales bacterium]